jgi:ribosomal protein S18 acetylase RimI-like enzyme
MRIIADLRLRSADWSESRIVLRQAETGDLAFLTEADIKVDLEDDGLAPPYVIDWNEEQLAQHRAKIGTFLNPETRGAWVCEDAEHGPLAGTILYVFRDFCHQDADVFPWMSIFDELDRSLFPSDGRFCEVFNLWVEPAYRRQGLGTRLKRQMEAECRARGIGLIYTHTRECNQHVIDLNLKMGYEVVRRGPIWDDVIRVSLVKHLTPGG